MVSDFLILHMSQCCAAEGADCHDGPGEKQTLLRPFLGTCRGSTGYGEDGIQSLPGNIGTNDVADCMTALDAAITQGADMSHWVSCLTIALAELAFRVCPLLMWNAL